MRISRYEREQEETAGPRFTRLLLMAYGLAALLGLAVGVLWVLAGLLHFHPVW
jgi:hypothetical protein